MSAALALGAGPVPPDGRPFKWIDDLRVWLSAVEQHQPGTFDEAAQRLASWSRPELQTVWLDARASSSSPAAKADNSTAGSTSFFPTDWTCRAGWRPDAVLESAKRSDAAVYSISIRGKRSFLSGLSSLTGGTVFEVESTRNLGTLFLPARGWHKRLPQPLK